MQLQAGDGAAMPEAALPVMVVSPFQFQPHFALSPNRLWKARVKAFQAMTPSGRLCPNTGLYRMISQ
jgi:hypothetical protein